MEETKQHRIPLRVQSGKIIEATLERKENDRSCWIRLTAEGIDEVSTASDYFESFADVRRRLVKKGIFPLCYGASRDIWPSGMARDMGQGLRGYRLVIGQQAKEMRGIFETGEGIDPATPEEQKEFSAKWIESLKSKA